MAYWDIKILTEIVDMGVSVNDNYKLFIGRKCIVATLDVWKTVDCLNFRTGCARTERQRSVYYVFSPDKKDLVERNNIMAINLCKERKTDL